MAEIKKGDGTTVYVTADAFDDAFKAENSGAVITLLADVERTTKLEIKTDCTLDLGGHTITCTGNGSVSTFSGTDVTIQGEGGISSEKTTALTVGGTVKLKGGVFSGINGVDVKLGSAFYVSGDVKIIGTVFYGLLCKSGSVHLSGGTFQSPDPRNMIYNGTALKNLLETGYAYFYNGQIPVTDDGLNGTQFGSWEYTSVMVKECSHTGDGVYEYTQDTDILTHTGTCLACGKTETENCGFEQAAVPTADGHTGQCPACKRMRSGMHSFLEWTGEPATRTCDICEYRQTAVAKVVNGSNATYVGNLDDAFKAENDGAVITLLDNVQIAKSININAGNFTLDLNGKKISLDAAAPFYTSLNVINTLTIKDSSTDQTGTCEAMLDISGINATLTLNGGNFTSSLYAVRLNTGRLFVGSGVKIHGAAPYGFGLKLSGDNEVYLSGGTFSVSGEGAAIQIGDQNITPPLTVTLGDLLDQTGDTRYAYFDENGAPIIGKLGEQMLTGTVTVQECKHIGDGVCEYTHVKGTTTHQQTCLACGDTKSSANCSYVDGKCACGSMLSVALIGTEKLVYDGNPHEPGVTVTLDGTKLTSADYDVTHANNINAGTDTATVTVIGKGSYSFEIKKTFSIEKAEQEDFAVVEKTMRYEKNGTFTLKTTGGGGDGAVLYRVPGNNGVLMVNGDKAAIIGVGTVTVTATKAESDNYKGATATGIITIKKASAPPVTYPAAGSITYGQKLSDSALTGGSTEYGTFAWENGGMIPTVDNTGYTVVFIASEETKKNYETIADTTRKVSVKVEKAVPAVSIAAALSGSKDSRQAVLTVNVAKAGAGAFPTGTVTFIDCTDSTEREIGTAMLSNGFASYTWNGLLDKAYTIKAVYAGNGNYTDARREFTFDAAKQNQQGFALNTIGAKTYGDAAIPLKTTGGSGNGAVRYESSDEDVIRIENGKAVITGAGTATITAIKEGDDNYNEASAARNVTVAKKALTVEADNKTVVRGNPMPAFTYRVDGLVNGDIFTTAPSITVGAQDTDTLGKYDIVINGGTLRNSGSYSITYGKGTLHIVERFYTVTVTDGTGGGEYAEGDIVTVTANERNGYTFTGWNSEDGIAFTDSKAKTTTFTMPAKSVNVKANYIRNSSGGNNGGGSGAGGNSGGSGSNDGGGNSGGNENNGGIGGNSAAGGNSGDNGNKGGQGSSILWSVDGKSITADKAGDIDFSVKSGVSTVPVDIVNNVTGESYSIQLSLA